MAALLFPSLGFRINSDLQDGQKLWISEALERWELCSGGAPTFSARSSSNSFFNLRFSLVSFSWIFLKNSQFTSVCFSLVLESQCMNVTSLISIVKYSSQHKRLKKKSSFTFLNSDNIFRSVYLSFTVLMKSFAWIPHKLMVLVSKSIVSNEQILILVLKSIVEWFPDVPW